MSVIKYIINVDEVNYSVNPDLSRLEEDKIPTTLKGFYVEQAGWFRPAFGLKIYSIELKTEVDLINGFRQPKKVSISINDTLVADIVAIENSYKWKLANPIVLTMADYLKIESEDENGFWVNLEFFAEPLFITHKILHLWENKPESEITQIDPTATPEEIAAQTEKRQKDLQYAEPEIYRVAAGQTYYYRSKHKFENIITVHTNSRELGEHKFIFYYDWKSREFL
jgi:hypothetical protein